MAAAPKSPGAHIDRRPNASTGSSAPIGASPGTYSTASCPALQRSDLQEPDLRRTGVLSVSHVGHGSEGERTESAGRSAEHPPEAHHPGGCGKAAVAAYNGTSLADTQHVQ